MKSAIALIASAFFNTLLANPTPFSTTNLGPFFHILPSPTSQPPPPPQPSPSQPPIPPASTQSDVFQIFDPINSANCCTRSLSQNLAIVCPAGNTCRDFDYFVNKDGHLQLISEQQIVTFSVDKTGLFFATIGNAPSIVGISAPLNAPYISNYQMAVQGNYLFIQSFWGQTDVCFINGGGPIAIGLGNDCAIHNGFSSVPIKLLTLPL